MQYFLTIWAILIYSRELKETYMYTESTKRRAVIHGEP